MSEHRPEDVYGFVATSDIYVGTACAFREGDPVPDATVDENQDWVDDGMVVARKDWKGRSEEEPERAQVRGEMPPGLADKVVPESPAKSTTRKSAGAKSDDKTEDKGS